MNITTPVFLVGAERSGTTLLRLMLDHHPQIAFHYEFEFAVDRIDKEGNWPDLPDYYEYLSYHRIFLLSNFRIDLSLDYPSLIDSFLQQKMKRDNKPIVGATVHHRFHYLIKIWPQAKFIHLVRDGRDVAQSNIIMKWAGNMFTGAQRWVSAEMLWQQLSAHLKPEQKITIYYEELIRNPQPQLTNLCDFIGVPFDKAMFDYAKNSTYDLPDPELLQKWRQLTNYEIQLAESQMGKLLTERGYYLSGLPILKITPWLRWRLCLHDRWRRRWFYIQHYPITLYLQDILSRRLRLKKWRKQVRKRINAFENQNIK